MLSKIPLLLGLSFSVFYPLCFWILCRDPLKNGFHRFHLGLACFVAGITVLGLFLTHRESTFLTLTSLWLISLLFLSWFSWNRETVNPFFISIPCLLGMGGLFYEQNGIMGEGGIHAAFASILGGCVLSLSTFAMNLGHWYLNVPGLPIRHLMRVVYAFWSVVFVRTFWDICVLLTARIIHDGDSLFVYQFLQRLDGFLLGWGLLFGTLFPLVTLYFVYGSLKVKSTQSATGILYVILSAVLIGEVTFKYYFLRFGLSF